MAKGTAMAVRMIIGQEAVDPDKVDKASKVLENWSTPSEDDLTKVVVSMSSEG